MLFHMYQVFSSLQGHLHFFGHFSFTFMEYFFFDHPISLTDRVMKGKAGRQWSPRMENRESKTKPRGLGGGKGKEEAKGSKDQEARSIQAEKNGLYWNEDGIRQGWKHRGKVEKTNYELRPRSTVVSMSEELGREYWATPFSVCLFAYTA